MGKHKRGKGESERQTAERWQWRNYLGTHGQLWDWPLEICVVTLSGNLKYRGREQSLHGHFEVEMSFRSWAKTCITWTWGESSKVLSHVCECDWEERRSTAGTGGLTLRPRGEYFVKTIEGEPLTLVVFLAKETRVQVRWDGTKCHYLLWRRGRKLVRLPVGKCLQ